ncbi:MAG: FtsW/RodA/SpoVE family cell cycle protein, partial [Polyangiaceae bacterium]
MKNFRRLQLATPLDARPRSPGPSGPVDSVLGAVVVALVGFGVVMVYSASAMQATVQHHDPQFFLKRQVAYGLSGLAATWCASRFDYHR